MNHKSKEIYGLAINDNSAMKKSASSGFFYLLASEFINKGGIVYGAALLKCGVCKHVKIDTIDNLHVLQGSKYTWSDTKGIFKDVLLNLNNSKSILFSGTPCQVYALRKYLNKYNVQEKLLKNLFIVDLFCFGCVPNKLLRLYYKWLENKIDNCKEIINIDFTCKNNGWQSRIMKIEYLDSNNNKNEFKINPSEDPYYSAFLNRIILLEKCYNCPFQNENRVGDYSIGDFWGVENINSEFFDKYKNEGISVLSLNSNKAHKYFHSYLKDSCRYFGCEPKDINQPVFNESIQFPKDTKQKATLRKKVKYSMYAGDFHNIFDKLLTQNIIKKILFKIKELVRKLYIW